MTASITFEGVSKRYYLDNNPLLLSRLIPWRKGLESVWALNDLSFGVTEGETVAIVGANGAGKTTTLRLMAGVSGPTSGRVRVVGRVAPLIGIGVGFNPELTGRENVFVNGLLLGMTMEQIRRDFDAIVEFSELEKYLDTPVKFYSSGMFLRLGFSVAVHTSPEILVVDEILAVGDAGFRVKCNERMMELRESGTTIVLVTHNLGLAMKMARRVIVLAQGGLVFDGDSAEGIDVYHKLLSETRDVRDTAKLRAAAEEDEEGLARGDVALKLLDHNGKPCRNFGPDDTIVVEVQVEFTHEVENPCIGVAIMTAEGSEGVVSSAYTAPGDYHGSHGPGRPMAVRLEMKNHLLSRTFTVHAEVFDAQRQNRLGLSARESFFVDTGTKYFGTANLDSKLYVNDQLMSGKLVKG